MGTDTGSFRLQRGTRAAIKLLKTVRLASDPAGLVLITPSGRIEYSNDSGRAQWRPKSGKREQLLLLNMKNAAMRAFLFDELGLYLGVRFETPCEVLTGSKPKR